MTTYWNQIDIEFSSYRSRFFMSDCGGKDQVVRAVSQHGWQRYEPPLPLLIARQSRYQQSYFIDVGANTGYYSLLAASTGSKKVWAFEPVPFIRQIFESNTFESGFQKKIIISANAIGDAHGQFEMFLPDDSHGLIETSASLNPTFRQKHSEKITVEVVTLDDYFLSENLIEIDCNLFIKIDVESLEPQVLMGAQQLLKIYRPILALELLPDSNIAFFEKFKQDFSYIHYWLNPENRLDQQECITQLSLSRRDHLFVPQEKVTAFLEIMKKN
jgi:FkbM family methyltransferase